MEKISGGWKKLRVAKQFKDLRCWAFTNKDGRVVARVDKFENEKFYHWVNHSKKSCGRCANLSYAKKKAQGF